MYSPGRTAPASTDHVHIDPSYQEARVRARSAVEKQLELAGCYTDATAAGTAVLERASVAQLVRLASVQTRAAALPLVPYAAALQLRALQAVPSAGLRTPSAYGLVRQYQVTELQAAELLLQQR